MQQYADVCMEHNIIHYSLPAVRSTWYAGSQQYQCKRCNHHLDTACYYINGLSMGSNYQSGPSGQWHRYNQYFCERIGADRRHFILRTCA